MSRTGSRSGEYLHRPSARHDPEVLKPFDGGQNERHRALRSAGTFMIEKGSESRDVLDGVGRKNDHPIFRGAGRGSSLAVSQLAIQSLTSASGTASPV
jgi:hypothetical protein